MFTIIASTNLYERDEREEAKTPRLLGTREFMCVRTYESLCVRACLPACPTGCALRRGILMYLGQTYASLDVVSAIPVTG